MGYAELDSFEIETMNELEALSKCQSTPALHKLNPFRAWNEVRQAL
jgi:hypothetical protein